MHFEYGANFLIITRVSQSVVETFDKFGTQSRAVPNAAGETAASNSISYVFSAAPCTRMHRQTQTLSTTI